jgi:hypothetical protein
MSAAHTTVCSLPACTGAVRQAESERERASDQGPFLRECISFMTSLKDRKPLV